MIGLCTHIAAAVFAGLLVWQFQAERLGAELADERLQASLYREQVTSERATANARVAQAGKQVATAYQEALNDATQKQTAMQVSAARARTERDGLRKQLSDAQQRLADATPSACIEYASTVTKLFRQCSQRYTDLAIRADGHASDAATCRAAWPVMPVRASAVVVQ